MAKMQPMTINVTYNENDSLTSFHGLLMSCFSRKNPLKEINIKFPYDEFDKDKKENIYKIVTFVQKQFNVNPGKIKVWLDFGSKYVFDKPEFEEMMSLEKLLVRQGTELFCDGTNQRGAGRFNGISPEFKIKDVTKTTQSIDKSTKFVKDNKLSPLEALLYYYLIVTNKKYEEVDKGQNLNLSRNLFGVMSTNKVVCVGYAEWINELCKQYASDKLVAESVNLTYAKGHQANIIYIDDEKYDLKGYYYLDACFKQKDILNLNTLLTPLKDVTKVIVKGQRIVCKESDFLNSLRKIERRKFVIRKANYYRKQGMNKELAVERYMDLLRLITKCETRADFENAMMKKYKPQVDLAIGYAKKVFGEDFPPY